MDVLFRQPLFYVYFIYGASFLTMAYVISRGIRRATSMALVLTFQTLAAFGLTHGIRELLDWARCINSTYGRPEVAWLKIVGDAFLVVSFVILLQFAVNLLSYRSEKKVAYRLIPSLLVAVGIILMAATRTFDADKIGLCVRHSFGFAGSLLSGVAFCKLGISLRGIGSRQMESGLFLGALGFFGYSIFGGLIVTTVAGEPVQIFRALCAFIIALSSTLILDIFRQVEP